MTNFVIDDHLHETLVNEFEGNNLTIMLEYISNSLPKDEEVFDIKFGKHRVYLEREENTWRIYRLEKDENTIKV